LRIPIIFKYFEPTRNINEAIIELKKSIHREIINIDDEQKKIVKLFGQECEKYYF